MFTSKIKAVVVSGLILCCASSAAAQNYNYMAPGGAMPQVTMPSQILTSQNACASQLEALRAENDQLLNELTVVRALVADAYAVSNGIAGTGKCVAAQTDADEATKAFCATAASQKACTLKNNQQSVVICVWQDPA